MNTADGTMVTVLTAQPVNPQQQQQQGQIIPVQPIHLPAQSITIQQQQQQQQLHGQQEGEGSRDGEEEEEKHQCKECDKVLYSKKEFLQHMYMHKENPKYICPICSKIFPSEPGFKRHVRAHQNRVRRHLSCGICSEVFSARGDLEEHHRQNHLEHKVYRCQLCGAQFSWQDNLNKHMRMHNTDPTTTTAADTDAAAASEPHNYKCDICDACFMDNTSLRIHSRSHSAEAKKAKKTFTCQICTKEFKFDFSYIAHMNAHEKSKPKPKEDASKSKGPIQLVTEYGEEAPNTAGKVITELQLPSQPSSAADGSQLHQQTEMMVQIDNRPPYGVTYTPPSDVVKGKTVIEMDAKHRTEYTVIDDRRFVKSPFKGGRRSGEGGSSAVENQKAAVSRKRLHNPILYHLPMTDERPYQCNYCDSTFRWEVSLTIHEREHDPNYRPPEKTPRGRPRALDPGKDYTYRIVRRRDSDEEDDEEFEDIKGTDAARPKRRYRKKKDLEKARTAFQGTKAPEDQPSTVVKLTRTSIQPQADAAAATADNGEALQTAQPITTVPAAVVSGAVVSGAAVSGYLSQHHNGGGGGGTVQYVTAAAVSGGSLAPGNGLVAVLPAGSIAVQPGQLAGEPVYAVNHQGVHFQVLTDADPNTAAQ